LKKLIFIFCLENNVPMLGILKVSIIGLVSETLNM